MSIPMKKWFHAIAAAMLFSCTLALFGPLQLFIPNSLEFDFSLSQLLPSLGAVAFAVFLLLVLMLMLLPERFNLHERGVALVFTLGFLLWFQGNFLVWKYGLLDGQAIDWGKKIIYGLIDTPIWIACLLLAAWRPAFLYRRVRTLALLVLIIQLLLASFFVINQPELPSFKKYQILNNKKFDFSKRKNIIILVVDTFQSDVFQEVIDKDPSCRNDFRDFTYFRNNTGGFPSTYAAVPFLLTAQYYTNSQPIQSFLADAYMSPSSIPRKLMELGWKVDLFPLVMKGVFFDPKVVSNIRARKRKDSNAKLAHLFDITLFRYLPHFLKRGIHNDEKWLLTRWGGIDSKLNPLDDKEDEPNGNARLKKIENRKIRRSSRRIKHVRKLWAPISRRSARDHPDVQFVSTFLKLALLVTDNNVFKFYHWRGIHEPFRINANLEPVELPLNRSNVVTMARGEIKLLRFFLDGLRELGVYDNALIFILGDHGHPYGGFGLRLPADMKGVQSATGSMPLGVLESGIPLLLVKRPGDHGDLAINNAPVSLADVQATIFDDLGLGPVGIGEPLFKIPVERPRERRFLYYHWEHSDWMNRYLPELIEYRINGNSWLSSSWRETGKVLEPQG
jgi:hypothetical protein